MAAEKTNALGTEPVGRLLFKMAVPAITAQIVNMLYTLVDRMYIGHLPEVGAAALTGVGVTMPIIMIISAFSALIGMGGAPLASIKLGQGDYEGAERILGNCFVTLLGISVLLTAFFMAFQEPLLLAFGASENTISYALEYMNIYVMGTIFVQMALGLNNFITSQGFAGISMLTVVIGAVINIALDPVLMFTFQMGVKGAAIATILSQAISSAWVLWFLVGKRTKLKIRKKYFKLHRKVIFPVLALGVSPFIMQSTESLVSISLNSSLKAYGGDLAVGAMAILTSLMQMITLPMMGLTQGAQPILGFNYGARKPERVKKAFRLLLIASLSYTTLFWLLGMLFPQMFVLIFNKDPDLLKITVWAARIYLGASFALGAQFACQQTFVAVGQAKVSLFLALLRKVILLIPLIYILPNFVADKVFGVLLAEPIADALASLTTVTVFIVRFRKILSSLTKEESSQETAQPAE